MEKKEEEQQPTLKTVEYLRKKGLEALVKEFKVGYKRLQKYPNIIRLKYDQLESSMGKQIVQECRGLILDEEDNWKVLAFPYAKFFNYNETKACTKQLDWNSAKVYHKIDGSLCIMYNYKNEWFVATSSTPDASGNVYHSRGKEWEGYTFAKLFWEIWEKLKYLLPTEKDYCFMFELFSARNRVVVVPKEETIYLHGARNLRTFQESEPEKFSEKYSWKSVPIVSEKFSNLNQVIESAKKIDISVGEGFVVCDKNFQRIKVKSPQYIFFSLLNWKDKEGLNKKRMIEVVRHNEGDEFISYYPQWIDLYNHLKMRYEELVEKIQTIWEGVEKNEEIFSSEKNLAIWLEQSPQNQFKPLYFALRKKKIKSIKEFLKDMKIEVLESWLPEEDLNTLGPDPTLGPNVEELTQILKKEKISNNDNTNNSNSNKNNNNNKDEKSKKREKKGKKEKREKKNEKNKN